MRMPEVMIAILLVLLLAGCKEEKLARGETAPALAAFDLQGNLPAWNVGKGRRCISISGRPAAEVVSRKWIRCRRSANAGRINWWWWG
jgi:hypothetical protein